MNKDFLNIYTRAKSIPSGHLRAWYNFDSGNVPSGIVYNQVIEETGDHFFEEGHFKSNSLGGISLGDHKAVIGGYFDKRELVQISDNINYDSWSVFFDIDTTNQQQLTGKEKILLSSMEDSGAASGFFIGLNGYNKPFITYAGIDGKEYTHTFSRELINRNLLSVSFNRKANAVSIGNFSPKEDYSEDFIGKGHTGSSIWTIGGFKKLLSLAEDGVANTSRYVNFDGTMNHFLLFSPSLKGNLGRNFSNFLFINEYASPQVRQRQTLVSDGRSGAYIESGITGTGITGYETTIESTITGSDGTVTNTYTNLGITGELSGDVIRYTDTIGTTTGYESYLDKEIETFDNATCLNFFGTNLIFPKNLETRHSLPNGGSLYFDSAKDSIIKYNNTAGHEVYASKDIGNDNFNNVADYYGDSGMFVADTGIKGRNLNLYRNGLLQRSGTIDEVNLKDTGGTGFADYTILDSRFIYSNNRYDQFDYIVYDKCDLPNLVSGYIKGPEDYNYDMWYFLTDLSEFENRDLYFGGVKLISGTDYDYMASTLAWVRTEGLDSGVFSWVDNFGAKNGPSTIVEAVSGSTANFVDAGFKLMDEIVWSSGIRQKLDTDYIKTADFSVLNSGYKFNKTPNKFIIYNGGTGKFNI